MATNASSVPLSRAEGLLPPEPTIGLIGMGAVGTALARALTATGYAVPAVYSRRALNGLIGGFRPVFAASAQDVVDRCDVVFLTVPDRSIEGVATSLRWHAGQVALHCSGALGTGVLNRAAQQGACAVALHPLCTLPRGVAAEIPTGTHFAYTGPAEMRPFFAQLAGDLGGVLFDLPESARALYHAAAVIACNYTISLTAAAVSLLQSTGLSKEAGLAALLPLLRGTFMNLDTAGLPGALTGPVVRGDLATVAAHRAALEESPYAELYDVLARATAGLALERTELSDEVRRTLLELKAGGTG